MSMSSIRSAVLIAVFAGAGTPVAVAQEAEPPGAGSRAAERILRLVDGPSPALERALSADSLRAPGGLWNAAALLQAELGDRERQRLVAAGSRRGGMWRGERRHAARSARGRKQRYDSGRQLRGEASRGRQQVRRSRNFRDGARSREAARAARQTLGDSALTVRERRRAIARAVREQAAGERRAAAERATAERRSRDAALGIDSETRATADAELQALRARFDSLRQQADTARRDLRSFRAKSAGTEGFAPDQKQVIQLHAALGRLLQTRSRRNLSRKR